jgi:predicted ATPase
LQEKRRKIYQLREEFLRVVNDLFAPRKRVSISPQNELSIQTINEKPRNIPVAELSSGEKQLLIILGEALLQENRPVIYIADEPELSLHVKWQERLVESIRRINGMAQVVFATHSPDIVGPNPTKVLDLEDALR